MNDDKVNILLVDDQPARLLSYETVLAELDQNLIRAHSGEEALQLLMKHEFAVLLLDVSMPGMDGFETASLIHQHPRFEKTPIIFVTGVHQSELDRLRGYKLGAVDYVYIPVVPEILRSKVSVLVELYCKRRELQKLNASLAEANTSLAQANTTLQAEKNRELEDLNATLHHANADLEAANRSLQAEIGERRRVEQALKEADRHKDEFLAMLAHELRNPLAPIRNAVEIMRRRPVSDPQVEWSRDVIERQLGHLTRLVDDLLDVFRITRGTINLAKQTVNIAQIVARAIEINQPLMTEQRHELIVDVPEGGLQVHGDATRLTQVLGNLLNNAAKYTDPGGCIHLSVERRDNFVEIRVRDNGIGIPSNLLPRLFELFTQVDQASHRTLGGLGIGLALVRRLVEMHGGTVSARSDGANRGSEFLVALPLVTPVSAGMKRRAHPAGPEMSPETNPSASCARRVLLADDNPDALDSLSRLLACEGHEVQTAVDGIEALELAEQWQPEVALLDVGITKLDGYEVARRIRERPWGKETVLISLAGWDHDEEVQRSLDAGFDSHFTKPLDHASLTDWLARLPAGSRLI